MTETERDAALYRAWRDFEAARYEVQSGIAPDEYLEGKWDEYREACEVVRLEYWQTGEVQS